MSASGGGKAILAAFLANMGIAVHPDFDYSAIEANGEVYIVASELAGAFAETCGFESQTELARFKGSKLDRLECKHAWLDRASLLMNGEHVTLGFIDQVLGQRGKSLLPRAVDFLCGLIILALAWRVWVKAGKIAAYGDTTDVLRLPVAPFVYFMTIMVAVTGVVHLVKVIFPPPPRGPRLDPEKASMT